MSNVNVYQQRPDTVAGKSPLHHAGFDELAGKGRAGAGVTLREYKLLGHLVLRGDGDDAAFRRGVQQVTGLELPGSLSLVGSGESSLQWLGPNEWLLTVAPGSEFEVEGKLRAALAGQHISVINVSGGQTLLQLSGPKVRELLMKSTSYDVHPNNFPVGKAVGTTFAKSQLVIRRPGDSTWELVVRRSFADYIWLWLQDASAEYGLAVEA